jgi:hypothetical protein
MVELQAKTLCVWGEIHIGLGSAIRAYDESGRCFSFNPLAEVGWTFAIDVESKRPDSCNFVSLALGPAGLSHWVEVEVTAKLINTPAHIVLRKFLEGRRMEMFKDNCIEVLRIDTNDHWVAVGRRRCGLLTSPLE